MPGNNARKQDVTPWFPETTIPSPVNISYRIVDDDTATLAQLEANAIRLEQFDGMVNAYADVYILPKLWDTEDSTIVQNDVEFKLNVQSSTGFSGYYSPLILDQPPSNVIFNLRYNNPKLVSKSFWGAYVLTCYQPATSHAKNRATDKEFGDADPNAEGVADGHNRDGTALIFIEPIKEYKNVYGEAWDNYVAAHEIGHQFGLKDQIKNGQYDDQMGIMGADSSPDARFCQEDMDKLRTNMPAGSE